jgi:hypothetical protein
MIGLYCRAHHGTRSSLCPRCDALGRYAQARIERCPFGAEKPTCKNCTVHCFQPARREEMREVMRFAGPRMTWRYPVLALLHLLDGRRRMGRRAGRSGNP